MALPKPAELPVGHARPRVGPPLPARSDIGRWKEAASDAGIDPLPWQETAARYIEAVGPGGRPRFREVAVIVARQNGKSKLLVPLIISRLRQGRRIMHTAQDRALPREVFYEVSDVMSEDQTLFPQRNGRPTRPRFANGQEEIRLNNGGMYSIVAPTRSGARGSSRDLVIIDELREMEDYDFIAAAKPTMTASSYPQILYLSNAGTDDSVVLNALRERREADPTLAYLEWSAGPDRKSDDVRGWLESNPAIGHERDGMADPIHALRDEHRVAVLEGTMAYFETEHLCRWVQTLRDRYVDGDAWRDCHADALESSRLPCVGVAVAPEGTRASVVMAFQQSDGTIGMRQLFERTGSPVDLAALGDELRAYAAKRSAKVAFDPMTDGELAKYVKVVERVNGSAFTNASEQFVRLVDGKKLRWHDADAVTTDLAFTSRKEHDATGSFQAVRSSDDRPITAALAAIRAVWLASGPRKPKPRVY